MPVTEIAPSLTVVRCGGFAARVARATRRCDSGRNLETKTWLPEAVLAHRIVKEDHIPDVEIDRAVTRMRKFRADPQRHMYSEE